MKVHDRDLLDRATATYAPEQLGRTQYFTPEGYLLCEGVRIARTGPMLYAHSEMPEIEPGPGGQMITVTRDAEVLFAAVTLLSASGKSVTNEHPDQMVSPLTINGVEVGVMLNPRQGEGVEADYMVADLLIKEAQAIDDVRSKRKREVSLGYDAEVEQVAPGYGRQTKVEVNHVALVKRGRAGPSCAIQDEEPSMATRTTRKILDGIRKAFKAKDEAALEQELNKAEEAMDEEVESDEGNTHRVVIEVAQPKPAEESETADEEGDETEQAPAWFTAFAQGIEARIAKIEEGVAKNAAAEAAETSEEVADEDKAEEEEEKKEAEKASVTDTLAKVEALMPGHKLPKFDSATPATNGRLTGLRREVLTAALADSVRKVHVEPVLAGRDLAKMRPSMVSAVFDGAAALAKAANNSAYRPRPADIPQGPMTAAKMQERIVERRKTRAH